MTEINLTVIGGGSVNWMSRLMRDVYQVNEIDGGEIRLVDPQTEHVRAVAAMLEKFNEIRNKDYNILIIENRKKALKDADFVMTTFSPGTMDAFWNDLEIPVKYGIRQPVSMTVGPSGISAALRTAPVAYEIVEDMEEMCPGAWLLNVTNPMSVVTRAMNMAAETVKVVGMCHEFHAFPAYMGKILNLKKPENMDVLTYLYEWLEEQGFEYTIAGLNHFIWLTRAELNGRDVITEIQQYCKENKQLNQRNYPENGKGSNSYNYSGFVNFALCRRFGYLPIVGDRHLIEFYPNLCNPNNGYGMKYGIKKTTVGSRRLGKVRKLEQIKKIAAGKEEVDWNSSGEEMVEIIRGIINDNPVKGIVNMPNQGQIENLPEDVIVETLATVSADGITPKSSGKLPGSVGSLCRLHADVHELTVEASLQGDKDKFTEALSLDPLSGGADFSELGDLADELLQANRKWLPRFFD